MSPISYHIFVKAPSFPNTTWFARSLQKFGLAEVSPVELEDYPDAARVVFNGISLDILNEKRSRYRSHDPEDPEFGYDFDIVFSIEGDSDNPRHTGADPWSGASRGNEL